MRNVLSLLKPYRFPATIALALMLVELAVELLLPFFLGKMINDGVLNQNLESIVYWGSIMLALAILAFIAGLANSFFSSHVSFQYGYDLRQKLFEKVQNFSFEHLSRYPTSSLVTRFTNDIRQIQNTVFMGLRIMAKAPLMVIGGVTMAFVVNASLAFIFLITVPLLILFLLFVFHFASKLFKRVQGNVDGVNRIMQENLLGMRLIKAFMRRDFEESRFDTANHGLAISTKKAFRFVEFSTPLLLFVMNCSLIFILWFGNIQITDGRTNVGEIVTIVNYALRISMSISMFSFLIMGFSRAKASLERIHEIFSIKVDTDEVGIQEKNNQIEFGKITYEHVYFRFPGTNQMVLKDINFIVQPAEKIAIMGETGSGKTSIFQLLPKLYHVTSGDILIDDKPISTFTEENLRQGIGYVAQDPLLFSGTIKDNIAWGKKNATMDDIIRAAKDAQIHETILELPDGYNTKVGQKGVNLSGGQKQRLSIARALIRQPKILMLDDSTSALDLTTESRLLQRIATYKCTMMIITQKISSARKSDRILLLQDGEMLAFGTHEELLYQSALYQKMVESQFGKEFAHGYETT